MKMIRLLNSRIFVMAFTFCIMIVACSACFARSNIRDTNSKKFELRAGAGFWSSNDLIDNYSDVFASALTGGMYSVSNEKMSGNYSFTYRYALKDRLSVGASFVYSRLKMDLDQSGNPGGSINNYFTLAPEIEYKYIDARNFKLYGFAGAGATINRQTVSSEDNTINDNNIYFNFQLSPLCAQFGENLGMYLEAGFGYKGILCLGIFTKF